MHLMQYISNEHLKFLEQVHGLYSKQFLKKTYDRLSIADEKKRKEFVDYAVYNAVNYLDACEINQDRLPVFKQRKILENYKTSLKRAKREFNKVESNSAVNSVFHSTLRKKIKTCENADIEKMFHPYMQIRGGKHEFWYRSEPLFNHFLDILIETAGEAHKNIREDFKADLRKKFLLDWVTLMRKDWSYFTDITFGLGDWLKGSELGNEEQGMYKSVCVDVLYDLFHVVDKKITRSEIENAIRKIQ